MTLLELLFVIGIIAIVAAMAAPLTRNQLSYLRVSGDARTIANALTLAKMRAAATFTQVRVYVDLNAKSFKIEAWQRTGTPAWVSTEGSNYLRGTDQFSFGSVGTPPPYTQTTIAQSGACRNDVGAAITNTACIVFNSRGVPITPKTDGAPNGTEPPLGSNALYVTDNTAVYAATASAAGTVRLWRTGATASPNWTAQ
jgi:Tfp pilus assembly protein FimT